MKNGIYCGIAIGMVIGALLMKNNSRVREIVDDAQQMVKAKMAKGGKTMHDCECACDVLAEQAGQDYAN